jgi:glycerol-3-phosphate dehydrogenase (NAD(P)+)
MSFERVGIVGAGAWGTALALAAARAGRNIILWEPDEARMAEMAASRVNRVSLPGVKLPEHIAPTADSAALGDLQLFLIVVPAQAVTSALASLKAQLPANAVLVLAAKGIDYASGGFLSDKAQELMPRATIGVLSGPSFAADVAKGLPTAVTLAAADEKLGAQIANTLGSPTFRPYFSTDVRGAEIGGAIKNALAIAAGIVTGKKLGASARAALIARGFAEMQRFGAAFGARAETFAGLSGLGDLVLTATSEQSRNLRFGIALGKGNDAKAAQAELGTVEGIATAHAAIKRAKEKNIDMPVTEAVARILENRESIDEAIARLMLRPLKGE